MERYTSAPSGWLRWRTPRVAKQTLATASTPRSAVSFRIRVLMLVSYRVALSHRLAVHLQPVCSLPYRAAGDLLRVAISQARHALGASLRHRPAARHPESQSAS